jgi:SAM-dependent methyltransferase
VDVDVDVEQTAVEEFLGTFVGEVAAAQSAACAYLGDRLGLYEAMAGAGPITAAELATRTGTLERYVLEWLRNQAAGGYVAYHGDETFELPPERAAVLADRDSATYLAGFFEVLAASWAATDRLVDTFRGEAGLGWHEHDPRLHHGVARVFGPMYRSQLVSHWIPALDGVREELEAGALVADVGCGLGVSTVAMAKAFPASRFVGFDYHAASVAEASRGAAETGVGDRVAFEVADASSFPGEGYDLVCVFDALHDMGDPLGAATRCRAALRDDGTLMLVEPMAGDDLAENLHPVGRLFYSGSALVCVPTSLAQEGQAGLGAQAGEQRLRDVLASAGFSRVRRAVETPFNLVLEARP